MALTELSSSALSSTLTDWLDARDCFLAIGESNAEPLSQNCRETLANDVCVRARVTENPPWTQVMPCSLCP
jgi:hypothetical protein